MSRRNRSEDEVANLRIAQHRKTAPLRKQVESLAWAITHEPDIAKADAMRRQLKPLQIKLARLSYRYINASVASELMA